MKSSEKVQLRQRRLIPRGDVCVSIYHSSGYVPDLPPELFYFFGSLTTYGATFMTACRYKKSCNPHDGTPSQGRMKIVGRAPSHP